MLLNRHRGKDANASGPPGPSFMTPEQVGQQPFANARASLRPSPLRSSQSSSERAPTKSEDSHRRWTADFLADLRTNRPARPNGARPLPNRNTTTTPTPGIDLPERSSSAMGRSVDILKDGSAATERSASALWFRSPQSPSFPRESIGMPLAKQPKSTTTKRDFSGSTNQSNISSSKVPVNTASPTPDIPYYERGQRWMEKQETMSLRAALEVMDLKKEKELHEAAQGEAAVLVWRHRNPGVPYKNPDTLDFRHHLRKGSHARSQSVGPFETLFVTKKGGSNEGSRSASDGSNSNNSGRTVSGSTQASGGSSRVKNEESNTASFSHRSRNIFSRRRSSGQGKRNASGESGKGLFRNPEDQIYEEPEAITQTRQDTAQPAPLKIRPRNTSYTFRNVREKAERTQSEPVGKKVSIVDIHKNPPSQSRNAEYQRNTPLQDVQSPSPDIENDGAKPMMKNGIEVRSDDIRAATSMRMKDRSPKLPSPTVVSDRPSRPIVSFAPDWKPREVELKQENPSYAPSRESGRALPATPFKPQLPAATSSAPIVPTINISETPSIQVNDAPSIPTISLGDIPSISISPEVPPTSTPTINVSHSDSARPLSRPDKHVSPANRPLPHHSSTTPVKGAPHWSPALQPHRAQAQCAACALPISGRIVSAASQRFHPACFTCFHCGELLECVAFYPEPTASRDDRLARIRARLNNDYESIPPEQSHFTEADDGDDGLRFYCHLDYHEKFSPRCRSCKTPIEGEVVLACGGEWHVGHFFCAECGDPFDASTPFVEKDGFAWCVNCHCRRFSGKCAGCRKPITETVVKALGREWHEGCFCCKVSERMTFLSFPSLALHCF